MTEHTIKIVDGVAEFVYSDDLVDLTKQGDTTITRASHVEPHPTRLGWIADMAPSGGPVLGKTRTFADCERDIIDDHLDCDPWDLLDPFETREEALQAEREWLRREKGL